MTRRTRAKAARPVLHPTVAGALLALTLASRPGWTQTTSPGLSAGDRTALFAARAAVWNAWFAGDTAALARVLPANTLAVQSGDTVWQKRSQIIADAATFHAAGGRMVDLEFPRVEVQVLGDVAVLYSTFRLTTAQGEARTTRNGTAVEVFVHRNGAWQNPSWYLDFTP